MTLSPTTRICDGGGKDNRAYVLEPGLVGATTIDVGDYVTMRTLDASGDQIREDTHAAAIDQAKLFPVTGPVNVRGVQRGETLGLAVCNIRTAAEAHCWTRPGIGIGPDLGFYAKRVVLEEAKWPGRHGIPLAIRPHVGTLGVLPNSRRLARDLGDYGGNVDCAVLGADSVLWVRAQVAGGGVFAGDVHAGIGDAEICGTGLEAAAEVDLQITSRTDWAPPLPVITKGGRAWIIGIGATVDAALRRACVATISAVRDYLKVPEAEAYLLASQLLEVRICQVVNPNASVTVSLAQGLDVCLGPPTPSNMDRLHPSEAQVR